MRHDAPEPARRSQSLLVRRNHAALAFCPAPLVDSLAVRTRGVFLIPVNRNSELCVLPDFRRPRRVRIASRRSHLEGLSGQVRVNRALPGDGEAVLSLARSPTSPGSMQPSRGCVTTRRTPPTSRSAPGAPSAPPSSSVTSRTRSTRTREWRCGWRMRHPDVIVEREAHD